MYAILETICPPGYHHNALKYDKIWTWTHDIRFNSYAQVHGLPEKQQPRVFMIAYI